MTSKPSEITSNPRPRLLMIAYCFDKHGTMEERNGWNRAMQATRLFDVTVLCSPKKSVDQLLMDLPADVHRDRLRILPIRLGALGRALETREPTFYSGYRMWQSSAFQVAQNLIHAESFHLLHNVTLCGYREPGPFWKLGIPHVWGPIGGTHDFEFRYQELLDFPNYCRESIRTLINRYQLSRSEKFFDALKNSIAVIAATEGAKSDFARRHPTDMLVDLETGIDYPIAEPRHSTTSGRPIQLLWTGRLRAWKGLPLLLHALAQIADTVPFVLRVIGDGQSKSAWQRLARRLDIAHAIEWLDWPGFRESLPHYRWADAFLFTSLRDTSGTGLLDALAAATPIIGIDHQGASDIMSPSCSIPIPVDDWSPTVDRFADAIKSLASDRGLWERLSQGASQRATRYHWNHRRNFIETIYMDVFRRVYGKPLVNEQNTIVDLVGLH